MVLARVHLMSAFPFVRVVWISLLEEPKLDLSIRSLALDLMAIPGLDSIIRELIMTAIRNEVLLPMGKVAPAFMANADMAQLAKRLQAGRAASRDAKEAMDLFAERGAVALFLSSVILSVLGQSYTIQVLGF